MPEPYSLTPVDHDPFEPMAPDKIVPADSFADRFKFTPVEHDPFEPQVTNPTEFAKTNAPASRTPMPPVDPRRFTTQEFPTPQQESEYPSKEEANFARQSGFGYGTESEAYSKGDVWRNAPSMEGLINAKDADSIAPFLFATPETDVPPKLKQEVAAVYQKSALVANRSPVTALGYDPSKFAVEFGDRSTNLGGFYQPGPNEGWANAKYYYSIVHESTHRGLEEIRKSGLLSPATQKFLDHKDSKGQYDTDELVVRHLMQKHAGVKVPPETEKSESDKLERSADWSAKYGRDYSDPKPFSDVPWTKRVEEIEQAAIKLHAKKRPGGPR